MQRGGKPRRGDVILAPFPFADLQAAKARPALIVSGASYHASEPDLLIAAITGNVVAHQGPTDYTIMDWRQAGLVVPSVVKASLATIDPRLVRHHIGRLSHRDLKAVDERLRLALDL